MPRAADFLLFLFVLLLSSFFVQSQRFSLVLLDALAAVLDFVKVVLGFGVALLRGGTLQPQGFPLVFVNAISLLVAVSHDGLGPGMVLIDCHGQPPDTCSCRNTLS